MKKQCSWCGKVISQDDGEETGVSGLNISHGMCSECSVRERAKIRKQFAQYRQAGATA